MAERYEELRRRALHGEADGFALGLAVLERQGVVAWISASAGITVAPARDPEGPAAETEKGALESRVRRLDALPPGHADPPRCGPERDALPPGQLHWHRRQGPPAAAFRLRLHQWCPPGLPHRLRERAAPKQPPAEWALPPCSPVGIRPRMAGKTPPGPLVEPGLVGKLLFLRGSPGRRRQVPQFLRQQRREQLPIDQLRREDPVPGVRGVPIVVLRLGGCEDHRARCRHPRGGVPWRNGLEDGTEPLGACRRRVDHPRPGRHQRWAKGPLGGLRHVSGGASNGRAVSGEMMVR
jgi:hypothetical protein